MKKYKVFKILYMYINKKDKCMISTCLKHNKLHLGKVHGNTLKVAIFSEQRLGIQNKINIQNQLVEIYKMVPIFSIFCHFLKIRFCGVNTFRGKTQIGSW